jgi:predicted nucleic acid-binding protein
MNSYVIDAYAWIEYLDGTEAGKQVKKIIEDDANEIYTCAVTVAEVISKVARKGLDIKTAYDILLGNSQVVNVDEELSKETGLLHAEMRKKEKDFGLADAYVLATAKRLKSKVLTGDLHFKNVKEAIVIK